MRRREAEETLPWGRTSARFLLELRVCSRLALREVEQAKSDAAAFKWLVDAHMGSQTGGCQFRRC